MQRGHSYCIPSYSFVRYYTSQVYKLCVIDSKSQSPISLASDRLETVTYAAVSTTANSFFLIEYVWRLPN